MAVEDSRWALAESHYRILTSSGELIRWVCIDNSGTYRNISAPGGINPIYGVIAAVDNWSVRIEANYLGRTDPAVLHKVASQHI